MTTQYRSSKFLTHKGDDSESEKTTVTFSNDTNENALDSWDTTCNREQERSNNALLMVGCIKVRI